MPANRSILDRYTQEVLRDNPAGFWPLSEPAGMSSPFARDYRPTTSPNPGTYGSYSFGSYNLGQPGPFQGLQSCLFIGSGTNVWGAYVTYPSTASLSPTSSITIECWLKGYSGTPYTDKTYGAIIRKEGSYVLAATSSNGLLFGTFVGSNCVGGSLPTSRWSHVVATYSTASGQMRLYINGQLAVSQANTNAIPSNTSIVEIGGAQAFGDEYLTAYLAAVAVYPSELSPARIAEHYAVATGQQGRRRTYGIPNSVLLRRSATNRTGSRGVAA